MLDDRVPVWDIIGRALVVYDGEQAAEGAPAVAAVIARSAVAGDNNKKICACDGTIIWNAGDVGGRQRRVLIDARPSKK